MTISATTQGLRMGVATSSSRPTVPFDGQVISETDTDSLQVYKGTAWGQASGLVLIKAQTIGTGVTSVAVTAAFSATYDAYKITVTGGVGSANSNINMVLGSTTTGYYWCSVSSGFDGTGPYSAGAENISSFIATGLSQTSTLTLNLDVLAPYLSKITTVMGARTGAVAGSGGAYYGFQNTTTSFTDFTLSPTSGTLTGGTIRVYGYANS